MLPLLGLLVEQPSHAYQLTSRLRERYEQLPTTRSTVTSLLKALERTGLVASRRPEQAGNRPPRTTYELTEAGMVDFRRKVEAGLREGQAASMDFIMAVAYAGFSRPITRRPPWTLAPTDSTENWPPCSERNDPTAWSRCTCSKSPTGAPS